MIYVDNRAGSSLLAQHIVPRKLCKLGRFDADIEFMGYGPDEDPLPIGIEYKTIPECLNAMTEGRLTGTQVARMVQTYGRSYLLIEGAMRVSRDGVLELPAARGKWKPAYGRRGEGWTAREFWNRLISIEEFTDVRFKMTHNIKESAKWLVGLYHWWQKPYGQHRSWRAWDQSKHKGGGVAIGNVLLPTSNLPLEHRFARELYNVGQEKAPYIARHFGSAAAIVLADEAAWAEVEWVEHKRHGGTQKKRFSPASIRKIIDEIWKRKE